MQLTMCDAFHIYRGQVLDAVKEQKKAFHDETASRKKAQESQRLLALLFYTALPPGRSKEFQTLHYAVHGNLPSPTVDNGRPNCLHITSDGKEAYILLADYKTHKHYGDHFVPLQQGGQLLTHLAQHLNTYRQALVGPEKNTFLFLVSPSSLHVHTHKRDWIVLYLSY